MATGVASTRMARSVSKSRPEDRKAVASLTDPKIAHRIASIALKTARHLKRYLAGKAFDLSKCASMPLGTIASSSQDS